MAKKKEKVEFEVTEKEQLGCADSFNRFLKLSLLLLNVDADYCPMVINELKESNPFYKDAKAMAKELGIDWKNMSDEESNRIMINLLSDAFMASKPKSEFALHIKFNIDLSQSDQKQPKKEGGDNAGASE